ncbi:MAG: FecR domain-containing protein, partial [Pseudomonadota bacterium]
MALGNGSGNIHSPDATSYSRVLDADGASRVDLPEGLALLDSDFARAGSDLVITTPDGARTLVQDFFATETPPALAGSGGVIDGALASKLAGPLNPGEYAQAGGAAANQPIGTVSVAKGAVEVRHADGTSSTLKAGDPVFSDDVVSTAKGGSVGLTFQDGTTFSLGSSGRMVLDEMVYDPATKVGSGNISLVKGAFAFVSGQIPKSSPDALTIKTPIMTVGIRGTAGGGNPNTVGMIPEAGGVTGEMTITTPGGAVVINTPGTATTVTNPNLPPQAPFSMPPGQMAAMFGSAMGALPNPGALDPGFVAAAGDAFGPAVPPPNPPPDAPAGPEGEQGGEEEGILEDLQQLQDEVTEAVEQALAELAATQVEIGLFLENVEIEVREQVAAAIELAAAEFDAAAAERARLEAEAIAALNVYGDQITAFLADATAAKAAAEAAYQAFDLNALQVAYDQAVAAYNKIIAWDSDTDTAGDQFLYAEAQAVADANPYAGVAAAMQVVTNNKAAAETAMNNAKSLLDTATGLSEKAVTWRDGSAISLKVSTAQASSDATTELETLRAASEAAALRETEARNDARPLYIARAAAQAEWDVRAEALRDAKVSLAKSITDYVNRYKDSDDPFTTGTDEALSTYHITTGLKDAATAYAAAIAGYSDPARAFDAGDPATYTALVTAATAAFDGTAGSGGADLDNLVYSLSVKAWIDTVAATDAAATSAQTAYTDANSAYTAAETALNTAISAAADAATAYVDGQTAAASAATAAATAAYDEVLAASAAQIEAASRMDDALSSLVEDLGTSANSALGTAYGDVAQAADAAADATAAVASYSATTVSAALAAKAQAAAALSDIATRVTEVDAAVADALAAVELARKVPTNVGDAAQQAQDLANQQLAKAEADYAKALAIQSEVAQQQALVQSYYDQVSQAETKALAL